MIHLAGICIREEISLFAKHHTSLDLASNT